MLSENKRLSLLLRQNSGRYKLGNYKQFFVDLGLLELKYIELEEADSIVAITKSFFLEIEPESEIIDGNSTMDNSSLLVDIYNSTRDNEFCYIFIDGVDECGMFRVDVRSAFKNCLDAAKRTFENDCFLVDYKFKFSFMVSYYDENDRYDQDKFYIQRRIRN